MKHGRSSITSASLLLSFHVCICSAVWLEQAVLPVYAEKVNFERNACCASVPGHTLSCQKLQEVEMVQVGVCAPLHIMGLI